MQPDTSPDIYTHLLTIRLPRISARTAYVYINQEIIRPLRRLLADRSGTPVKLGATGVYAARGRSGQHHPHVHLLLACSHPDLLPTIDADADLLAYEDIRAALRRRDECRHHHISARPGTVLLTPIREPAATWGYLSRHLDRPDGQELSFCLNQIKSISKAAIAAA